MPGRPFKKGQSGNPKGRPAVSKEVRLVRKMNHAQVELMLNKYMGLSKKELTALRKKEDLPVIDGAFIKVLLMAFEGKLDHLNFVMDRTVGKVMPDVINNFNFDFTGLPREEIIARGKKALEIMESDED